MSRESFLSEIRAVGEALTTDQLSSPNRFCFVENNTRWNSITISRPSILFPTGTPGTVLYAPAAAGQMIQGAYSEFFTAANGVCFLHTPGQWFVQVQNSGSGGNTQCFVCLDLGNRQNAVLINALQAAAGGGSSTATNITRIGGTTVTGIDYFGLFGSRTMAAPTSYSATTTSGNAVGAATTTRFLYFKNLGTARISLGFGATAVDGTGIVLAPGEAITFDVTEGITTQAVNAVAASGTQTLSIQTGT